MEQKLLKSLEKTKGAYYRISFHFGTVEESKKPNSLARRAARQAEKEYCTVAAIMKKALIEYLNNHE